MHRGFFDDQENCWLQLPVVEVGYLSFSIDSLFWGQETSLALLQQKKCFQFYPSPRSNVSDIDEYSSNISLVYYTV